MQGARVDESETVTEKKTVLQYALIGIGILSVVLGAVGVFLPLLPTTPFLLLAAACFVRSSKRLHSWLMNHKWFGPFIYNYRTYKAIPRKTKIISIALLWATILYSAFWVVAILIVRLLLLCIAGAVTWHLCRLNTLESLPEADRRHDT